MQHSFKNTNQVQQTPPRRRLWTATFGGVYSMLVEMLISMISCGMSCHFPASRADVTKARAKVLQLQGRAAPGGRTRHTRAHTVVI
jgi:hypothetical protein